MKWPWRARAKGGILAISSSENSLRYVLASDADERGATLSTWGVELRGHQTREAFMKRVRSAVPAAGRAIAVLDPADYQILQIDAPNVPSGELRGAVRWRATEFLEGSPHDYTLDVLSVPGVGEGGGKVIAVVARNDVVRARMLDCESLGISLSVIDVGETAQRNLLYAVLLSVPAAPSVAAALVADAGRALVTIAVDGQLHFFRRFEFNVDLLAAPVDEAQPVMMAEGAVAETASRSLTQLHRSLDLWDDSYPHLPLGTLRVHAGAKTDAVVDRVAPESGVDTQPLGLSAVFKVPPGKGDAPWLDPAYLPLLGALLRPKAA